MISKKTFVALLCLCLLSISIASAMTYRDNDVIFFGEKLNIYKDNFFVVSNYKITEGQDPDGKNSIGETFILNGEISPESEDIKLTIKSGRHGSEEVARWFSARIGTNQNTYGDKPDKLNFAFLGDLHISYAYDKYLIKDVMIAQGHSGTDNDWWFGGKNCEREDGNVDIVECEAINMSENKIEKLRFWRGAPAGNNQIVLLNNDE